MDNTISPKDTNDPDYAGSSAVVDSIDNTESAKEPIVEPVAEQNVQHGVKIGGIGLLLPSSMPTEVSQTPVICPIPLAPAWVRGVTTLRGIAAPVFNIDGFFEHSSKQGRKRAVLLLGQGDAMVGIEIDALPLRVVLGEDDKLLNAPPLPDSVKPFALGFYRNADGLWLEWDIDSFFTSIADVAKRS